MLTAVLTRDRPLLTLLPRVASRLPFVALGDFPTRIDDLAPVTRGAGLTTPALVKRDERRAPEQPQPLLDHVDAQAMQGRRFVDAELQADDVREEGRLSRVVPVVPRSLSCLRRHRSRIPTQKTAQWELR